MISDLSPSLLRFRLRSLSSGGQVGRNNGSITSTLVQQASGRDRGDVDPAPLLPALQRALGELHALDAFQQRELVGCILVDVTDEHLPLLPKAVVVGDIVGQLLP